MRACVRACARGRRVGIAIFSTTYACARCTNQQLTSNRSTSVAHSACPRLRAVAAAVSPYPLATAGLAPHSSKQLRPFANARRQDQGKRVASTSTTQRGSSTDSIFFVRTSTQSGRPTHQRGSLHLLQPRYTAALQMLTATAITPPPFDDTNERTKHLCYHAYRSASSRPA